MPRRSPWMDQRAALLVEKLHERHGLTIDDDTARHDISTHIDTLGEHMGITRRTAKQYITDDWIDGFADQIAAVFQHHRDAVRRGEVADLDAKRRQRFPRPESGDA